MSASVAERGPAAVPRAPWRRLSRPSGIVRGTRWLYLVLALLSLWLTLPAVLAGSGVLRPVLGAAAVTVLSGSWVVGYRADRPPRLAVDVVDAAALTCLGVAGPEPAVIFPVVFAALWFRSMYGSRSAALLRCTLYCAAMLAAAVLWAALVPGNAGATNAERMVPSFPVMFVTVVIGLSLQGQLLAREKARRRDAVLVAFGSGLLGLVAAEEILEHMRRALTELCALTPGLRVVLAEEQVEALTVRGAAGDLPGLPAQLPEALAAGEAAPTGTYCPAEPAVLDTAAGTPCAWLGIPLPHRARDRYVFVGAPGRIPQEALAALLSVTNQVALALRNTEVHEDLTAQARTDTLTGLANRTSFTAALADALAAGTPGSTAVLFIDLDDFKDINDGLGHAAGDALLREVAARLRSVVRLSDICARLGGDEFAVLLPDTTAALAETVAQRLVEVVAAPVRLGEQLATVGASVGVALAGPDTALEELVQHADTAMYAAKANGKNRVQLFRAGLLHGDRRDPGRRRLGAGAAAGLLVPQRAAAPQETEADVLSLPPRRSA